MKRKILLYIVTIGFLGQQLWADAPGTGGFQFLRNNTGARPAALGGAFVAIEGDVNGLFYNPAGLAVLANRGGTATYIDNVVDFKSGVMAYYQPLAKIGTVGFGLHYTGYGDFKKTDHLGNELGTFTSNSFAFTGSIARAIHDKIRVGANVKYIYFGIDSFNSSAVAVDGGIIYRIPSQDLNIGLSFFNLGTVLSAFMSEKDNLPVNVRAGISKRLAHLPLLVNGGIYKFRDDIWQWQIGGEFSLSPKAFLRLGYDSIARDLAVGTGKDTLAGISLGFGVVMRRFQIDFSITSVGEVGSQNRITLSGTF